MRKTSIGIWLLLAIVACVPYPLAFNTAEIQNRLVGTLGTGNGDFGSAIWLLGLGLLTFTASLLKKRETGPVGSTEPKKTGALPRQLRLALLAVEMISRSFKTHAAAGLLALVMVSVPGVASAWAIAGLDAGASSLTSRTTSDAVASWFDAYVGVGNLTYVNFETSTVGAFTTLPLPDAVMTAASGAAAVSNTPITPNPETYGFNTTAGGSVFIQTNNAPITIDFLDPIWAFGLYLTGVQLDFESIEFVDIDGLVQSVPIPNPDSLKLSGGSVFWGLLNDDEPNLPCIRRVTIHAHGAFTLGDSVGVDDMRYARCGVVAEPDGLALAGLAFLLTGLRLGRRGQGPTGGGVELPTGRSTHFNEVNR